MRSQKIVENYQLIKNRFSIFKSLNHFYPFHTRKQCKKYPLLTCPLTHTRIFIVIGLERPRLTTVRERGGRIPEIRFFFTVFYLIFPRTGDTPFRSWGRSSIVRRPTVDGGGGGGCWVLTDYGDGSRTAFRQGKHAITFVFTIIRVEDFQGEKETADVSLFFLFYRNGFRHVIKN